jgi:hypothetical protein
MKKLDAMSAFVFMSAVRLILLGSLIFFSGFTIYLLFSGLLEERVLKFNMETESAMMLFAILFVVLWAGVMTMSRVLKEIRSEYKCLKNYYTWEK